MAVGAFLVAPSIEVELADDGNIYRANSKRGRAPGDRVLSVKPTVDAFSGWSRHELRFGAGIDARRHTDLGEEDVTDVFGEFGGRLDLSSAVQFDFVLDAAKLHEQRGDPDTAASVTEPVGYSRRGVDAGLAWRPGRWHLGMSLRADGVSFDDGRSGAGHLIVQSDRDRTERDYTFETGVQVLADGRMFLRLIRHERSYDRLTRGFDRNSSGHARVVGINYDVSGLISLEAFVGSRTQTPDDPRLREIDGPIFGLTAHYQPTMLAAAEVTVERAIEESALAMATGFIRTSVEVALSYQPRRAVTLRGRFGTEQRDYQGVDNEYDQRYWSVEGIWQRTRWSELAVGYGRDKRDGNPERDDYQRTVPFLRVRLSR